MKIIRTAATLFGFLLPITSAMAEGKGDGCQSCHPDANHGRVHGQSVKDLSVADINELHTFLNGEPSLKFLGVNHPIRDGGGSNAGGSGGGNSTAGGWGGEKP